MKTRSFALSLAIISAMALSIVEANAQVSRFQILSYTDRGGGVSTGGPFSVYAAIGQPVVVEASEGPFDLSGGFWTSLASGATPMPTLSIRRLGPNTIVLSWLNSSTGYVLQQTADLSAAGGGWADANEPFITDGANKQVMLQAKDRAHFFRLRRP